MEHYFNGQISKEEFLQLEALLEQDRAFKEDFYAQLELRQALANDRHSELRKRFGRLEQKNTPRTKWYLYAASVTILLGLGFFLYKAQPDPKGLYAEYFEAYPNVVAPTVRNSSDLEEGTRARAFRLYDKGDYAEAAGLFKTLYDQTHGDHAFFYHSVSLMAVGETQAAITALEGHQWKEPDTFRTRVHWYLALGYLRLEQREKALTHLKPVAESGVPLAKQAKEIMQKLE